VEVSGGLRRGGRSKGRMGGCSSDYGVTVVNVCEKGGWVPIWKTWLEKMEDL